MTDEFRIKVSESMSFMVYDEQGQPWPPGFVSVLCTPEAERKAALVQRTREIAQRAKEQKFGWGNGTLPMPGTPGYLPPTDMGAKR